MKFLVDAHFPKRLAQWLVDNGDDAIHTLDLPKKNKTPDLEIIDKAEAESRIIITKDSDFIQFRVIMGAPDRLLMVTTGNIINKDLIALFERNFPMIKRFFEEGKKVIEIDNESITVHK
jgi:predicted nuclease of predicted toxin-antitoxin system